MYKETFKYKGFNIDSMDTPMKTKYMAIATGALAGVSAVLSQGDLSEYSFPLALGAVFGLIGTLYLRYRPEIIEAVDEGIEEYIGLDLDKKDVEKIVDKAADTVRDVADGLVDKMNEGEEFGEALKDSIENEVEEETGIIIELDELEGLTVKQLKAQLKELGLSVSGRKAQLIDRLQKAVESSEEE